MERWNEKKYRYIFRSWEKFCSERNYNTMQINADIVLEFLTLEYNKDLSYYVMRNVLSGIIVTFHMKSDTILLSKSLGKGGFNLQSPNTQYHAILDVSILLNYLQNKNADGDTNSS